MKCPRCNDFGMVWIEGPDGGWSLCPECGATDYTRRVESPWWVGWIVWTLVLFLMWIAVRWL